MLEKSDLQAIRSIVQDEIKDANDSLRKEMKDANDSLRKEMKDANDSLRKEMKDANDSLRKEMKKENVAIRKEMKDITNFLIEEIGREHNIFERKFNQLHSELEEIKHYYISNRLESDSISLCLKMLDDINQRVEHLEGRSA